MHRLWDQSFTSLKEDLRQDINGGFDVAGALMKHGLEGSYLLMI